jgi:hypothetical protein
MTFIYILEFTLKSIKIILCLVYAFAKAQYLQQQRFMKFSFNS